MTQQNSILYRETFETEKGPINVVVDISRVLEDIQNYIDKLKLSRGIPYDLANLAPTDPAVMAVIAAMPWLKDDPERIYQTARSQYELQVEKIKTDAAILATTRTSPIFMFDPDPYPEESDSAEDAWDFKLKEPVRNLANPLERRIKQIMDALSTDIKHVVAFESAMRNVFVLAQTGGVKVDEDGFRSGQPSGDVLAKAKSRGRKPEAQEADSSV